MIAYVLFGHGSTVESANEAVRRVAREAASRAGWSDFETAFLGMGKPDLPTAVDALLARGARRVIVIPYFLTFGTHLERDLPALLADIRRAHPELHIESTAPLDGHPAMAQVVVDRSKEIA